MRTEEVETRLAASESAAGRSSSTPAISRLIESLQKAEALSRQLDSLEE